MQNILKSALKDRVLKKAKLPKRPNAVKDKLQKGQIGPKGEVP